MLAIKANPEAVLLIKTLTSSRILGSELKSFERISFHRKYSMKGITNTDEGLENRPDRWPQVNNSSIRSSTNFI